MSDTLPLQPIAAELKSLYEETEATQLATQLVLRRNLSASVPRQFK